jgi:alanine racemase
MADAEATAGSDAPALLTVDLAAIVENYRMLAANAAPAECAGVVKADAYGLGAAKVAPALHRAGCRTFFVATLDEGRALRALLPLSRIYVLDGLHGSNAAAFIADRLQPVLTSLEELERWRGARGMEAGLHLDTGLSRLGMPADEAARLAAERQRLEGITLTLVMSHLACADDPAHPMNAEQLARFCATLDTLPLPKGITRSLAASSGAFLGAKYAFDLVRPGAALYGIEPLARQPNPMRQVVRLQAKILQVRRVDAGGTVGYGATHRFDRPARLATIGVGYADGFMRSLSNRGGAYLDGRRLPIVGRVSMDLTVLDISGLPEGAARPGTLVDLIGPHNPVDSVATEAGTIGYEILTSLGRRYARRYLDGHRPEPR